MRDVVLTAIKPGRHKGAGAAGAGGRGGTILAHARHLLHPAIVATPSFTGRTEQLRRIAKALHAGETAAVTPPERATAR